jgi:multicomponent Na+:H+ antiporter subunit F
MIRLFGFSVAVVLVLLLPFIGRAIRGPTIFDRVVALNGMGTLVPVLMVLIGLMYERVDMFVDVAIAMFLLNLFTTLLIARYVREKAETDDDSVGADR